MKPEHAAILEALPKPPEGAVFSAVKVEPVSLPHPYCIGTRHVVEAADHFSGRLGAEAIESAERKGARCGMPGCNLKYAGHEQMLTMFIAVPPQHQRDLNACPGLHAYLLSIKEQAQALGVQGFAFPTGGQS